MKIFRQVSTPNNDHLFLPDFCNAYTVFIGILVTELLAFVLVLVPLNRSGDDWNYLKKDFLNDLAMISLFLQWVTLVGMALLCVIRRWLVRLNNNIVAGLISYLLILLVTGVVSELAWYLNDSILSISPAAATRHQFFLSRNLGMSAIISAIVWRYFYIQYHWKKETEALASAKAQALQARIRPHFLFNSMNTIASLIRFEPEKAEQMVLDFADLFRASLADAKTIVTFEEELALCRQYLDIEALRLGERLQVVWQLDNIPNEARLPPLSLQPLLENAVYHGIQPLSDGGTITISGSFDGQSIHINIDNPMAETISRKPGHRIAQDNIRQRLQILYGTQAKLQTQQRANTYHVTVKIPYKKELLFDKSEFFD